MCFLTAADEWGRLFVGGASLIGIGSLCYYGLGLAKEEGAIDRARCVHARACVSVYPVYKYFAHFTPFHWHSLILQVACVFPVGSGLRRSVTVYAALMATLREVLVSLLWPLQVPQEQPACSDS